MIVSIHHYELADGADEDAFREAVAEAERRDLFDLPGLADYQFLRGIKGDRDGAFTAVWTYESREAWEALWGPVDDPVPKDEYPERWQTWEEDLLGPLLPGDPDDIEFTSYETFAGGD
jgi:hypothetical protein